MLVIISGLPRISRSAVMGLLVTCIMSPLPKISRRAVLVIISGLGKISRRAVMGLLVIMSGLPKILRRW